MLYSNKLYYHKNTLFFFFIHLTKFHSVARLFKIIIWRENFSKTFLWKMLANKGMLCSRKKLSNYK